MNINYNESKNQSRLRMDLKTMSFIELSDDFKSTECDSKFI
jgi:hypothetical protein